MADTLVPLSLAPAALSEAEAGSETTNKAAELEKSYYNFEAIPVNPVKPTEQKPRVNAASADITTSKVTSSSITPLCTTLSTGTAYTLDGTTTGGSYCYHFEITQRAKTQVFLAAQNVNTDFALSLVRHEEDDTLTLLGASDQPGNADESLLALTEPGDYYWLMDANASDGSAFQFGAVVNTAADSHELNDAVSLSTSIPAGRTPMVGNMDSAQDVDYFNFVAENGQDLQIRLMDSYNHSEWVTEYFTGTTWNTISENMLYNFQDLPSPFTLHVRISPNPAVTVNPAHEYELLVGTRITSSDSVDVDSSENLAPIGLSDFNPPLSTQAHNELNWSMRVLDSNGDPVQGAVVNFRYVTEDIAEQVDTAISGSSGIASSSITLPDCTGNNTVTHYTGGETWETDFDLGQWFIRVDDTDYNEVGVGGDEVSAVWLGHICDQTLQ